MKNHTCIFTGHRYLSTNMIGSILEKLNKEVERLIANGVTDFISGGALGFDQMAASLIITKKEMGEKIRLIFVLPCKNQDEKWNLKQRALYKNLLTEADEIIYVADKYSENCMKERNYYMVDNAQHCICALLHEKTGTGQTVRYARNKGLKVINVAK